MEATELYFIVELWETDQPLNENLSLGLKSWGLASILVVILILLYKMFLFKALRISLTKISQRNHLHAIKKLFPWYSKFLKWNLSLLLLLLILIYIVKIST